MGSVWCGVGSLWEISQEWCGVGSVWEVSQVWRGVGSVGVGGGRVCEMAEVWCWLSGGRVKGREFIGCGAVSV